MGFGATAERAGRYRVSPLTKADSPELVPQAADSAARREIAAVAALAGIMVLRLLGLFMVYPVFAPYAEGLPGATGTTVGLALGIYGLTQASLQMPLGLLSDRIGRRPVIAGGLVVFAAGSLIAAEAGSIGGVIAGRAIQGCGAIGATVLALVADSTRAAYRTRAMAGIGMAIGAAFGLALVVGPLLQQAVGVPGIFALTGALGLLGIGLLATAVPAPPRSGRRRDAEPVPALLGAAMRDGDLLRLDAGIFTIHAVLTAGFVAIPLVLRDEAGLAPSGQWPFYLVLLGASVAGMMPLLRFAERRGRDARYVLVGGMGAFAAVHAALLLAPGRMGVIGAALAVFFSVFNALEALLPSMTSRRAPAGARGSAMGLFSSAQFLGIFVGGAAGGAIHEAWGTQGVFVFALILSLAYAPVAAGLRPAALTAERRVDIGEVSAERANELRRALEAIAGVTETAWAPEEGVLYVKTMRPDLDEAALEQALDRRRAQ